MENKDILNNHKKKWDNLARENDRYYVRSVDHEQTDQEYEESGSKNVKDFIENDSIIKEFLIPLHEKNILEIGCGSGRITKTLSKVFRQVVAIDISRTMLEKAEQFVGSKNVTYVESDGANVPVIPECVDLAFSYIVYQHFPSEEAVAKSFSGVWRALKPGGIFKVQIRGEPHPDRNHWSWGPHYDDLTAAALADATGFRILSASGQGTRSLWLVLQKPESGF